MRHRDRIIREIADDILCDVNFHYRHVTSINVPTCLEQDIRMALAVLYNDAYEKGRKDKEKELWKKK